VLSGYWYGPVEGTQIPSGNDNKKAKATTTAKTKLKPQIPSGNDNKKAKAETTAKTKRGFPSGMTNKKSEDSSNSKDK